MIALFTQFLSNKLLPSNQSLKAGVKGKITKHNMNMTKGAKAMEKIIKITEAIECYQYYGAWQGDNIGYCTLAQGNIAGSVFPDVVNPAAENPNTKTWHLNEIHGSRFICLTCIKEDFAENIDLCSQCRNLAVKRKCFIHEVSHPLLQVDAVILDAELALAIPKSQTIANQVEDHPPTGVISVSNVHHLIRVRRAHVSVSTDRRLELLEQQDTDTAKPYDERIGYRITKHWGGVISISLEERKLPERSH
ncbi:hypothetical protein C8R41DRAFT_870630 [Lentinula lateritia]|uniref:Uncharacterized protein n=1 Tax=Lentinula lateritia TaxID=40482 RepID=A0ABQ8V2R2_9AGAR|nr:hypothetical protein C8R41DRAFT_870630 [Lentinula lateritia]